MKRKHQSIFTTHDKPSFGALDIFRYIGPGFLVTVGFIDPGNWGSNIAAGAQFGYSLLWVVTLSTLMLILLQHNAAHLGIASGLCISEAASKHLPRPASLFLLGSAECAAIATALAEVLGGAIALEMLFHIPLKAGALIVGAASITLLVTNSYRKLERVIIAFVSVIGLSFVYELSLVGVDWKLAAISAVSPEFPPMSIPVIMSVLGAVVMPHNLFLHSEVIQSRQWNLKDQKIIKRQLSYEFADTLFSMIVGWAINCSMILVAACAFFTKGIPVTELSQAHSMLAPLLGHGAAVIFAAALLLSGLSSSVTCAMAGGSITAGVFGEPFDMKDSHSRWGVIGTLAAGTIGVLFISDPFKGLVYSQMALSIQLPLSVGLLIWLTSRKKIMGQHANSTALNIVHVLVLALLTALNVRLFLAFITGS
jgi:manganese transport protein